MKQLEPKSQRFGQFTIAIEMIRQTPALVQAALEGAIILFAKFDYIENAITYDALHPDFDEVQPGNKPPFYAMSIEVHAIEDGPGIYKFNKWSKHAATLN